MSYTKATLTTKCKTLVATLATKRKTENDKMGEEILGTVAQAKIPQACHQKHGPCNRTLLNWISSK